MRRRTGLRRARVERGARRADRPHADRAGDRAESHQQLLRRARGVHRRTGRRAAGRPRPRGHAPRVDPDPALSRPAPHLHGDQPAGRRRPDRRCGGFAGSRDAAARDARARAIVGRVPREPDAADQVRPRATPACDRRARLVRPDAPRPARRGRPAGRLHLGHAAGRRAAALLERRAGGRPFVAGHDPRRRLPHQPVPGAAPVDAGQHLRQSAHGGRAARRQRSLAQRLRAAATRRASRRSSAWRAAMPSSGWRTTR